MGVCFAHRSPHLYGESLTTSKGLEGWAAVGGLPVLQSYKAAQQSPEFRKNFIRIKNIDQWVLAHGWGQVRLRQSLSQWSYRSAVGQDYLGQRSPTQNGIWGRKSPLQNIGVSGFPELPDSYECSHIISYKIKILTQIISKMVIEHSQHREYLLVNKALGNFMCPFLFTAYVVFSK